MNKKYLVMGTADPEVIDLQSRLQALGYRCDKPAGEFGFITTVALINFQLRSGLAVSGKLDDATELALSADDAPRADEKKAAVGNIDAAEVESLAPFLQQAIEAADENARRIAVRKALVYSSGRFWDFVRGAIEITNRDDIRIIASMTQDELISWIAGATFTNRLDESRRRAVAGYRLLATFPETVGIYRLVAHSQIKLPKGDLQRNQELIEYLLRRAISDPDATGNTALVLSNLLDAGVGREEEISEWIERGLSLAAPDHRYCDSLRISVANLLIHQSIAARDDVNKSRQHELAQKAITALDGIPNARDSVRYCGIFATAYELKDDYRTAAELHKKWRLASKDKSGDVLSAQNEARVLGLLKEWENIIEILEPIVTALERAYVSAVIESEVVHAGKVLDSAFTSLAFAYARKSRWADCFSIVDAMKSRRFSFRAGLRDSEAGQKALELEQTLVAASLGLDDERLIPEPGDHTGGSVAALARVQQIYHDLTGEEVHRLEHTHPRQVVEILGNDAAVLPLAIGADGTLAMLLRHRDTDSPSASWHLREWTIQAWYQRLGDIQSSTGWLFALGAPDYPQDRRKALSEAIQTAEAALGDIFRKIVEAGVRRLTIIPHGVLHLIPWSTLPSLSHVAVTTVPNAHMLVSGRGGKTLNGRSLTVVDPTLDLSLAELEARSVAQLPGQQIDILRGAEALESEIESRLQGCSHFHFSGHGRSELTNAERSALLVYPQSGDWQKTEALVHNVHRWQQLDTENREGFVHGIGLVSEHRSHDADILERFIDTGIRSTFFARYEEDRPVRLAELFTARDLTLMSSLQDCALVFLSACEAGSLSLGSDRADEYGGLPAAFLLAGAGTVIAPMWPVTEILAAVYCDFFYTALSECSGKVDVADVNSQTARNIARLTRNQAVDWIDAAVDQLTPDNAIGRFLLEGSRHQISSGPEQPFANPYDWGAFQVVGSGQINII